MLYSQIILLIPHFFVKFSLFSVRVHCYRACEKFNSGRTLKVIHVLASNLLLTGAFGPVRGSLKNDRHISCFLWQFPRFTDYCGFRGSKLLAQALGVPFACYSRVISRVSTKWRACSQTNFLILSDTLRFKFLFTYGCFEKKIGFC